MKLCYPVATPDTADLRMLALRAPLEEAFASLARAGYGAAELMLRDPSLLDAGAILRAAANAGIALPAVSTGQVRKEDNLSWSDPVEYRRRAALERTERVIDFAAELGAHVNIGTLRGNVSGHPNGRAQALRSLHHCLEYASRAGVRIALEPQTRAVVDWINNVDEAAAFCAMPHGPGLLFDLYHAQEEERSSLGALVRAFPHVLWVQISDTNRRAPGQGSVNWVQFLDVLGSLGYEGYLSVECRQEPDSLACLRSAATFLRSLP